MWHPLIKYPTANKFRTIIPDLRGFGESHNFADINAIEDMAEDIAELLTSLKIERAIFVGLSMGGYVLLNLFPAHLKTLPPLLILVDFMKDIIL